jgi:hypothetical protein
MRSWQPRHGYSVSGYRRLIESDRRDAVLMLEAQTFHGLARNFSRVLTTDGGATLIHCGGKVQL